MSLLGALLSSCDDKSICMETEEFALVGFVVKDPSTIQIIGPRNLVIEETTKDWNLYVQDFQFYTGTEPLVIED